MYSFLGWRWRHRACVHAKPSEYIHRWCADSRRQHQLHLMSLTSECVQKINKFLLKWKTNWCDCPIHTRLTSLLRMMPSKNANWKFRFDFAQSDFIVESNDIRYRIPCRCSTQWIRDFAWAVWLIYVFSSTVCSLHFHRPDSCLLYVLEKFYVAERSMHNRTQWTIKNFSDIFFRCFHYANWSFRPKNNFLLDWLSLAKYKLFSKFSIWVRSEIYDSSVLTARKKSCIHLNGICHASLVKLGRRSLLLKWTFSISFYRSEKQTLKTTFTCAMVRLILQRIAEFYHKLKFKTKTSVVNMSMQNRNGLFLLS